MAADSELYVLRGGHLIDPKNGINAGRDIAFRNGRIEAVAEKIAPPPHAKVLDISGLYVAPGLVDVHAHHFHTTGSRNAWAGDNSLAPDTYTFRQGITTSVDTGSAGWRNFETFLDTVIQRTRTRVLALVNIAGLGMLTDITEQDSLDFRPERVAELAAAYPDIVVGVKCAHYRRPDWTSVDQAVEAGKLAGIPAMIDFGHFLPERPYRELVTEHLRPGDISTHMFRAPVPWLDDDGNLLPYLHQARERGVLFDVGHGRDSFVLRSAVPAIQQGFWPDSISTDMHALSMNTSLLEMPGLLSKFLALGMPLHEVLCRATWKAAQVIRRPDLGHLSPGATADIAVLRLTEGAFRFSDAFGGSVPATQRLSCEMTIREGEIVWNWNSIGTVDYRELGPAYGIRHGVDTLVR